MVSKFRKSLWFRLFLGFLVPLVLFLAAATVSYIAVQRLINAIGREQASQKTLARLYDMNATLEAMAAAKRAHHLTGKIEFKNQFTNRRANFEGHMRSLRETAANDAVLLKKIDAIDATSGKWLSNAEPSFELWKNRDKFTKDAFLDWFMQWDEQLNLNAGVKYMKIIHEQINLLERTAQSDFQKNRDAVFARTTESIWAIVAALIMSIGLGISVTQILSHSVLKPIKQLKVALAEMRQGNFEAITPYGPSEIAELIRGFNLMGIALAERTMVLETSELRYRTVVGTTSQMLWTTDAQGNNTDMTDWRSFTGQAEDDIIGDGWLDAVHPDDRERFVANWVQAVASKYYAEDEFRIRSADGEFRTFSCRSIPINDEDGEIKEWIRVCIDITERKQEEEMRRQRDAADVASRAKSEFLAKMSHELRTPLNAIIGMSKMLNTQRFGKLNPKQLDYLSDITQAGEHLLALINDILDLSKVEAGRVELSFKHLAVGDTIDNVVSTVRTLAADKKLKIRTELPKPDGEITSDLGRFKQILYNLISNAVKFTPPNGKVIVRGHWVAQTKREAPAVPYPDAQALRIDVEDSGIGVSEDDQEKLGNEFFQAERNPNKAQEGTGLGLALTKRLVQILGGEFWFTSETNRGSTFSFVLPIKSMLDSGETMIVEPESANYAEAETKRTSQRALALIIDDHKPTNKLLADWLDEAEIDSVSAYDGPSGINAARRHKPQVILLDVRLPGMSGFEVLHQLRQDPKTASIPIVMVTILEGQNKPQELDIVDWFVKPLDKDVMLNRLKRALPGLFLNGRRVLIVDTADESRKTLQDMLKGASFDVQAADAADQAFQQIENNCPDLILLNPCVRESEGFDLIVRIRAHSEWNRLPIIIVTDNDLSGHERKQINGNIQAVYRREFLTVDKLVARLQQIL